MEGSAQFLSLPSPASFLLPSLAPQLNQLGYLEERCKLVQRGPGGALAENEFGALRAVRSH